MDLSLSSAPHFVAEDKYTYDKQYQVFILPKHASGSLYLQSFNQRPVIQTRRTCPGNNTPQNTEQNRRNNDVTPIYAPITKTNMADIYTDARAHSPNSGNCICVLFMEHLNCTWAEKYEFGRRGLHDLMTLIFQRLMWPMK